MPTGHISKVGPSFLSGLRFRSNYHLSRKHVSVRPFTSSIARCSCAWSPRGSRRDPSIPMIPPWLRPCRHYSGCHFCVFVWFFFSLVSTTCSVNSRYASQLLPTTCSVNSTYASWLMPTTCSVNNRYTSQLLPTTCSVNSRYDSYYVRPRVYFYMWEKSQYERPAGRGHALWTLISLQWDDHFTNGHLNTMSPSNQSCIWPAPIPAGACHGTWHVAGRGCRRHPLPR